jgi:hypothetical protein
LSNADLAQQLEHGALRIGHKRAVRLALETRADEADGRADALLVSAVERDQRLRDRRRTFGRHERDG